MERSGRGPAWRSALLVAVFAQIGAGWAAHAQSGRVPLDGFARLLLLIGPVLLVVRHRYPVAVAYGVGAVTLVYVGAGYPYGPVFLSLALACFAAVVAGHRRAAWGAVGLFWAGHLLIGHWLYRWLPPAGDGPTPWAQEVGVTAWVLAVLAVAELVRVRREQWGRERAERAAAERRRVDEERLRIARELHDVLAHSISVINVQAGSGWPCSTPIPSRHVRRSPPSRRRARRHWARSGRSSTPCAPPVRLRAPPRPVWTASPSSWSRPRRPG